MLCLGKGMLAPVLVIAFKVSSFLLLLGSIVLLNSFSFFSFDFLSGDFSTLSLSQLFDFYFFWETGAIISFILVSFEFSFNFPLFNEFLSGETNFL
jgi:hypothetical protein